MHFCSEEICSTSIESRRHIKTNSRKQQFFVSLFSKKNKIQYLSLSREPLPYLLLCTGKDRETQTQRSTTRIAQELLRLKPQPAGQKLCVAYSPLTVGQFSCPSLLQIHKQGAHCTQTSVFFFFPPYQSRNATNTIIT